MDAFPDVDAFLKDLRYAARSLRKSPGFTAVVVLTVALGIGANTAIFSAVNVLLLRPLSYPEPERLVTLFHHYPSLSDLEAPVSASGFRRYRDETRAFSAVAVSTGWGANLTRDGEPERIQGMRVSAGFFDVFGVKPALGRGPAPEEDVPGREHVVVLSDGLWRRAFAADPRTVGQTLVLDGEPHVVIGVMPRSFRSFWNRDAEFWRPLALTAEQLEGAATNEWLALSGRLGKGVSLERAEAEMRQFAERLKREDLDAYPRDWTLRVAALDEVAKGDVRPALLMLLGAAVFVLLIACANVANLLLAQSMRRLREIIIRSALGAQRRQLVRQLLTESVLLGLLGGALGVGFALWSLAGLRAALSGRLPPGTDVEVDGAVLAFAFGLSLATGLLFGLLPALQASRGNLLAGLRESGRALAGDRAGQMARRTLIVAEIALALTLLTGAGLMIKSFSRLQSVDPGFLPEHLLTFALALPEARYETDEKRVAFFGLVLDRLSATPGIEAAGATSVLPFSGNWSTSSFSVEGYEPGENEPGPWGDVRIASPGYPRALGMRLVKGRFFTGSDHAEAPEVAVIDEELARRYFSGQDPLGRRITFDDTGDAQVDSVAWMTVVGVVEHTKHQGLDDEDRVQLYVPYAQVPDVPALTFAVRTAGDPLAAAALARGVVRSIDPDQPLAQLRTMESMMAESLVERRAPMLLLAVFSGLAALLACVGIYGVISHLVLLRTRELGVRMALGAQAGSVLRLILRQGLALALAGVAIGLFGAFALTRLIASQLYGVGAADPATFLGTAALLVLVASLASVLPAARAARLNPVAALRTE